MLSIFYNKISEYIDTKMKIKNSYTTALFLSGLFLFFSFTALAASTNCNCANGSPIPFYYPAVGNSISVASDDACNQECANRGAKYYSYSNLANVGYTLVTKTPNNQSGSSTGTTIPNASGNFNYIPLEKIPGSDAATSTTIDFYQYVSAVYKFGIWAVGIVALFMLVFGGYTYITSAGNNSSMETAKKIITDAIVGVIMALTAYLLLYVINPDLVKMKKLTPVAVVPGTTVPGGTTGTGNCQVPQSGACSVANLQNNGGSCFGSNIDKAAAICFKESANGSLLTSTVDVCQPSGPAVSYGLFQINLTAWPLNGLSCPSSCGPPYTSKNHTCSVTNQGVFNNCKSTALTPQFNVQQACVISNGGTNWNKWGANTNPANGCHF